MINRFGVHGLDQTDLVGNATGVRQQVADRDATLSARLNRLNGCVNQKLFLARRHSRHTLCSAHTVRQWRAVKLLKNGLMIKQIDVRRSARLKQINHTFGRWLVVRQPKTRPRITSAARAVGHTGYAHIRHGA